MTTTKKKSPKKTATEELFYFGLGLASLAKDQLEIVASALMKEGKLLTKDKEKFKQEIETKGQDLFSKMKREMEKTTDVVLKKMNIPSRKEFEALKRQVASKHSKK